jgi:hypothetical protein
MNTPRLLSRALTITVALTLGFLLEARGSVSYSSVGSTYSQNFDSLPNAPENVNLQTYTTPSMWTDDNATPPSGQFSVLGWYLYHPTVQTEGGVNGHQRVRIGAGTANTGAFMSWGPSGNTDRALGDLGSNTLAPVGGDIYLGLRLRNDTGVTLERFTLTYNGEQWRDGGAATPNAQTMAFMYSTTATAISDPNSAFTTVSALNFISPVFSNTGTGAAVDGNVAGRVNGITATVTGFSWAPGTDLWLRWDDISDVGNDHGLGIDDLAFVAQVPEPSAFALLALGGVSLLTVRRRQANS